MQKTETRELPCELNSDEIKKTSDELILAFKKSASIEFRRKEAMKDFKFQADEAGARLDELIDILDNGELRPVECKIVDDWASGERSIFRIDTGDFVEIREIPETDKQQELLE